MRCLRACMRIELPWCIERNLTLAENAVEREAPRRSADILSACFALIAFLRKAEACHEWVLEQFTRLRAPLLTEACFVLVRNHNDPTQIMALGATGTFQVAFDINANFAEIHSLMTKYRDVPM